MTPLPARAWLVVGLLWLVALLNYLDRLMITTMREPIKEAIAMFENAESDALAVVDGPQTRQVMGILTEQHALRRYSEELDRRRRELSGE